MKKVTAVKSKKTKVVQLKLGKSFNRGGAREGAGRPQSDNGLIRVWTDNTTIALFKTLVEKSGKKEGQLFAEAVGALWWRMEQEITAKDSK